MRHLYTNTIRNNRGVVSVIALIGFAVIALSWQMDTKTALAGQPIPSIATNTGLITHVFQNNDRPTQIIVVDSVQKRIAVYFVSQESGEIQLKSVRNIVSDLSMQEFNSGDPSPLDIQKLKERN